MGIIQWIKKVLKIDEVKFIEAPKEENKESEVAKFKKSIFFKTDPNEIMQKKMREKQLKMVEDMVLYEDELTKENICEKIQEENEQLALMDEDIQVLMDLYSAIKEEDMHGDTNIRDCIEDDDTNFIKLVNKIEERLSKKTLLFKKRQLITVDKESIKEIVSEMKEQQSLEDYE